MSTPTPWHRLFGIALTDLFTGRPWRVELEKELALKGQLLDVLIIERRPGQATDRDPAMMDDLPDGLEDLAGHNVLSFKSKQESLDAWALDELVGHYVTYRKLASIEATPALTPANADGPPGPSRARASGGCRRRIFGSTRWPRAAPPDCSAGSTSVPGVRGPVRVCKTCAGAAATSA